MRRADAYVIATLAWQLACGGSDPVGSQDAKNLGASGSPAVAAGASGSTAAPSSGVAGSVAAPTVTMAAMPSPAMARGPIGGSSQAGERAPTAAGSGGMAGMAAAAGMPAAGSGGSGGGAGGAGAPAAAEDAIIRGADPDEMTGTKLGPFKVAMYTTGFADKPGFLAATIYHPSDAEPPFSYVVFCPGFVSYQTSIQDWGPFLASHGIVIMTIDTNSASDSVTIRQTALKDALASLQAENERAASPLMGKLAKARFGMMGWSMGGGASLLDASMTPDMKSVVTVAEHLATSPGQSAPLKSLKVPALMFAGTADTAILGLGMSQPAYDAIPDDTTKMLYEVRDADHFYFNTPKALGGVVGKYALAWQKIFLEGDLRYKKLLGQKGPMASDFRSNLK